MNLFKKASHARKLSGHSRMYCLLLPAVGQNKTYMPSEKRCILEKEVILLHGNDNPQTTTLIKEKLEECIWETLNNFPIFLSYFPVIHTWFDLWLNCYHGIMELRRYMEMTYMTVYVAVSTSQFPPYLTWVSCLVPPTISPISFLRR